MQTARKRQLNEKELNLSPKSKNTIVYWMSRDQRVKDNWALIYALQETQKHNTELRVVFNLYSRTKQHQERHLIFMVNGLKKVEKELSNLNIHFDILVGDARENIIKYCELHAVRLLITDFSPLKHSRSIKKDIAEKLPIPLIEVDTHNIIPAWITSNKQEYAARTIRPKIHKLFEKFFDEFPQLQRLEQNENVINNNDWESLIKELNSCDEVKEVSWLESGEDAAEKVLELFLTKKLESYSENRNNANLDANSNLSPYLHFGQISAQRVVLEMVKKTGEINVENPFFEELVVRKELAENYCFYNENYDNPKGFPDWAKKTLLQHNEDPRAHIYTRAQLEKAETHDELWNSAQKEMVIKGKMHGYMRMYWAKKLLEWTHNVDTAQEYAIYLNDKYELDGRDPNGYTGIAWSLGGVHDRPWFNREIYGTVRYMARSGCEKKFDVESYIKMTKA